MTRHGGEVPDEVWAEATAHFQEAELIEIVGVIAAFNAFNRLANALRVEVTR
jgi:alkylhydroperoxidase family enzyme